MGEISGFQKAAVKLMSVDNWEDLETAACDAVRWTVSHVTDCALFLSSDTTNCYSSVSRGILNVESQDCIARRAIDSKSSVSVTHLPQSDPLCAVFSGSGKCVDSKRKHAGLLSCFRKGKKASTSVVSCYPLLVPGQDSVCAVLVFQSNSVSVEDSRQLEVVQAMVVTCWQRLKCHVSQSSHVSVAVRSPVHDGHDNAFRHSIVALCSDLNEPDATTLQIKINKHLMIHTQCDVAVIVLVDGLSLELYIQVIGEKVLDEEIRSPVKKSPLDVVIAKNECCRASDFTAEQLNEITSLMGLREMSVHTLLCVPVYNPGTKQSMGVVCLMNKQGPGNDFTDTDQQSVEEVFRYGSAILLSALAAQKEGRVKEKMQTLLRVAKNLFTHLDDLDKLLWEIMQEAKNLTHSERCSLFLLSKGGEELVARVFDGQVLTDQSKSEVRIHVSQGIVGHVATTGKLLNIHDAYSHPQFFRGIDESTGFKTRNILCFPIKDSSDKVTGVAQLCNKIGGLYTSYDEDIAQAFSVYCCISIMHGLMYKNLSDIQHRNKLSNELLIYHMQVACDEVSILSKLTIPPPQHFSPDFTSFAFIARSLPYDDTLLAIHSMMEERGFINTFRIARTTLARFLLMLRKGYRDPPYHNWHHAFSVAHFCYTLQKNFPLSDLLSDLELFVLFVSALCHDVDHRGTNNSYQVMSGSVLASLYSSEGSVMERHHLAQSVSILNTDGCNIFENLSSEDYQRALSLLQHIILATDLANHLRALSDIEAMAHSGFSVTNDQHKQLLLSLLMTCSDLSDQAKTWANTKSTSSLVYQEFFSQGDLEKSLGRKPSEMMDREKAFIPKLQLGFLDGVCLPVFKILGQMFEGAEVIVKSLEKNRELWGLLHDKVKGMQLQDSMDIFNIDLDDPRACESDSGLVMSPTAVHLHLISPAQSPRRSPVPHHSHQMADHKKVVALLSEAAAEMTHDTSQSDNENSTLSGNHLLDSASLTGEHDANKLPPGEDDTTVPGVSGKDDSGVSVKHTEDVSVKDGSAGVAERQTVDVSPEPGEDKLSEGETEHPLVAGRLSDGEVSCVPVAALPVPLPVIAVSVISITSNTSNTSSTSSASCVSDGQATTSLPEGQTIQ